MFRDRGTMVRFIVLGLLGFALAIPFVWMTGASVKSRVTSVWP